MLTRRQTLFTAGTALALGPRYSLGAASLRQETVLTGRVGTGAAALDTIAACRACHERCCDLTAHNELPASLTEAIADCEAVSSTTAAVLSRHSPLSPALCQSCSDACERLLRMLSAHRDDVATLTCRAAVTTCLQACRRQVAAG